MAKKATRMKSEAFRINLQTPDQVALAIKEYGDLEREQLRLATLKSDEKAEIDAKYTAEINAISEKLDPLRQAIQAYCESRRDELTNYGKQKTAYFQTGEVQWRVKPPSVGLNKISEVIERIKALNLLQFLRVKEEVNKDAMLADPDKARSIAGVNIKEGVEEFIIKPNDDEVR